MSYSTADRYGHDRKPHIYKTEYGWVCSLRSFTSQPHDEVRYAFGCARRCAPVLVANSWDLSRARRATARRVLEDRQRRHFGGVGRDLWLVNNTRSFYS